MHESLLILHPDTTEFLAPYNRNNYDIKSPGKVTATNLSAFSRPCTAEFIYSANTHVWLQSGCVDRLFHKRWTV